MQEGIGESERHEFKGGLPDARQVSKAACSFANHAGGFLVFGVKKDGAGWKADGLNQDPEFAAQFTQKLRVSPPIRWEGPLKIPIPGSKQIVQVIHIPSSRTKPHAPANEEGPTFWKRGNGTAQHMTLEEVRLQMLGTEQTRVALALLHAELGEIMKICVQVNESDLNPIYGFERFDPDALLEAMRMAFPAIGTNAQLLQELQGIRQSLRSICFIQDRFLEYAHTAEVKSRLGNLRSILNNTHRRSGIARQVLETQYGVPSA